MALCLKRGKNLIRSHFVISVVVLTWYTFPNEVVFIKITTQGTYTMHRGHFCPKDPNRLIQARRKWFASFRLSYITITKKDKYSKWQRGRALLWVVMTTETNPSPLCRQDSAWWRATHMNQRRGALTTSAWPPSPQVSGQASIAIRVSLLLPSLTQKKCRQSKVSTIQPKKRHVCERKSTSRYYSASFWTE